MRRETLPSALSISTLSLSKDSASVGYVELLRLCGSFCCCLWNSAENVSFAKSALHSLDLGDIACSFSHEIHVSTAHFALLRYWQFWIEDCLFEDGRDTRAELANFTILARLLNGLDHAGSLKMLKEVCLGEIEYLGGLDHSRCLVQDITSTSYIIWLKG